VITHDILRSSLRTRPKATNALNRQSAIGSFGHTRDEPPASAGIEPAADPTPAPMSSCDSP
jgi:hypothetical protein